MSFDDDFLEEPADERGGSTRPRSGGRRSTGGARPPRDGGGAAGSPLQQPRIRALIALGLLVVVALILISTVRGCQRDKLVDSYTGYTAGANAIATESDNLGKTLQATLANKGLQTKTAIIAQVQDLANKSTALVERAKDLSPPDRIKGPHQTLVTALEYRAQGLGLLPAAIDQATVSNDKAVARTTLAEPLRIVAVSDVIYRTSFVGPVQEALQADKIKDVNLVDSVFFPGDTWAQTSLAGAATVIANLQRRRDTQTSDDPTGTGKHGVNIETTFASGGPSGRKQLTPGAPVTLISSPDITFEVTIGNGGDFAETNVAVKVTYITPDVPEGTVESQTIDSIDPGEAKQVKLTFPLPGGQAYLSGRSTLKVEVAPVPNEKITSNNVSQYPLEFDLQ